MCVCEASEFNCVCLASYTAIPAFSLFAVKKTTATYCKWKNLGRLGVRGQCQRSCYQLICQHYMCCTSPHEVIHAYIPRSQAPLRRDVFVHVCYTNKNKKRWAVEPGNEAIMISLSHVGFTLQYRKKLLPKRLGTKTTMHQPYYDDAW